MVSLPRQQPDSFHLPLMNATEFDGHKPHLAHDVLEKGVMKIRVRIMREDIEDWRRTPNLHPLVAVMHRTTHTSWRVIDSIMLAERQPPFRTVFLGSDLMLQLLDCKNGHGPDSLECEIELLLPFCE